MNIVNNNKNFKPQTKSVTVGKTSSNIESDISELISLRKRFPNNPMIGYLNINHIGNKIINLRDICFKAPIDILCIDETKLDCSYPDSQFHIDGYQFPPFRKDRNKNGGGKIVYTREGIIVKRLKELEGKTSEIICLELTISKKKWCVTFAYRPPQTNNKKLFFSELNISLNLITNKYENILLMGDLNIDILNRATDTNNYLSDLCDTFSLTNIISGKTCFKKLSGTSIDILLTNRSRSFHNTAIIETGLSDHHKLIISFLKSYSIRLPPKKIEYRNYKKFDTNKFLRDLDKEMLKGEMYSNNNDMYVTFHKGF